MIAESRRINDESLIRHLRDELTGAIRVKDSDKVLSFFSEETVMFILSPPLQFKSDEGPGRKGIEEWFSTFKNEIGYQIQDLQITTGETVAFCHSLNRISGERTDGSQTDIWVRETLGFRKIQGEWKISHQHQSVPMYMDGSNKAAIDLKP